MSKANKGENPRSGFDGRSAATGDGTALELVAKRCRQAPTPPGPPFRRNAIYEGSEIGVRAHEVGCSGSLQAERHEWHDAEGVSRWQWFLIVDPSPALLQYLREQNTFGLVAGSFEPLAETPVWFRFDSQAVETFRSLDGGMHLAYRTKDHRIYASAHGFGFTKSTAMPKAVSTPGYLDSVGRLPNTSPPTPED